MIKSIGIKKLIPGGLLLCCLAFPALSGAQELGSIAGKVVDARGVPVPGATVSLFAQDAEASTDTLTEFDGTFSFENLPEGLYRLVVSMEGFQKTTREKINPAAEESAGLTITITRVAAAGAGRTAPEAGARPAQAPQGGFQQVELSAIPGMERFQQELGAAGIDPGAILGRQDNSDLLVITGNPTASMDAGDWNDPRFRDRIMGMAREMGFSIMSADGSGGAAGRFGGFENVVAAFGGDGGGGGGYLGIGGFGGGMGRGGMFQQSKINGSITSTYTNSVFNARPYSITGKEVDKPVQIRNNFEVAVGGVLPSWMATSSAGAQRGGQGGRGGGRMNIARGQWFVSYSGSRNRNPYDSLTTVPTALERAGDFSQTFLRAGPLAGQGVVLYDPAAATPTLFQGAKIPATRLNPAAAALLQYIPLPNLPGSVQNFTMQRGLVNTSDSITARINTSISTRGTNYINYSFRRGGSISSAIFPGLDTDRGNRAQNLALGGVYRFRTTFVLNYSATFNRVRNLSSNDFAYTKDVAGQLGIKGGSRDPINFGLPTINFTNYGDLSLGTPSLNRTQTLTLRGSINKIGTRHTLQAGGDIAWNQRNTQQDSNARGTYDFTGYATSRFDAAGRPIAGSGHDLADFLLGLPYSTSRRFGSSNNYLRGKSINLYVQDNWRVRPSLSVSLGLRYEYAQPYYEKYDRIVGLDVAPGFTAVAQVFPGATGPYAGKYPRSLVRSDRNNFGPRIGIAWKPSPRSRWVFRTGYGLFFNPSVYPMIVGQLVGQPPFAVNQDILTTTSAPLTLTNGFPVDPSVTILNTYAIDPNYRIGLVHQWNLNVQTQLFRLYSLELGYNGSKGTRLDILRAPNRAPSGSLPGTTEDNRVISNAGNFVYQSSGADSIMHSATLGLGRMFSRGARVGGSYTFAKSIDNASGVGGGRLTVVQDDRNIDAERSLSSFDQRHRFNTQFSYELPLGERRKYLSNVGPFLQAIVAGWNFNGTFQLASGSPVTARLLGNVANNSGTGSNNAERPDATGSIVSLPRGERTTGHYFNTQAFAIPAPGVFGNAGRNTIPGPGSNTLNMAMRKSFRLADGNRRLEFRWQVSNVLNHPNWSGLGTTVNALNFGRVTGTRAMRQMDFNIRINF